MQNLCTNPSFETTAAGFWTGNATQSADYAKDGSYSAKVTCTFTNGSITAGHNYLNSASAFTPTPGNQYLFSAYIYVPVGSPISLVRMGIRRYDTYDYLSSYSNQNVTAGEWVRRTVRYTPLAASPTFRFIIADPVATGYTGSASYYVDKIRIHVAAPLPSFLADDL